VRSNGIIEPNDEVKLLAALAGKLVLFAGELIAGACSGSLALLADSLHCAALAAGYATALRLRRLPTRDRPAALQKAARIALVLATLGAGLVAVGAERSASPNYAIMVVVSALVLPASVTFCALTGKIRDPLVHEHPSWIIAEPDIASACAIVAASIIVMTLDSPWPDFAAALVVLLLIARNAVCLLAEAKRRRLQLARGV